MLQTQPIVTYVGESKPIGNIGKMENTGWEFNGSYRWKVKGIDFRFSANASYLKNKLVDYGTESGENDVESMSAAGFGVIAHAKNGEPYPYFYGYETAGVFQNEAQIAASGLLYGDRTPVPGDLIFVDQNGDGVINDADNTKIGKGMPDWTYGFALNADYKGFDFVAQFQGVLGVDIYDAEATSTYQVVKGRQRLLPRTRRQFNPLVLHRRRPLRNAKIPHHRDDHQDHDPREHPGRNFVAVHPRKTVNSIFSSIFSVIW